jgi:restriction endonuclease S subunit
MTADVLFDYVPLGEMAEVIMGSSPPSESYNEAGIGVPLIMAPQSTAHAIQFP